ncbi:DUF6053 domain-containing protein [Lysobacter enzymogenes]
MSDPVGGPSGPMLSGRIAASREQTHRA